MGLIKVECHDDQQEPFLVQLGDYVLVETPYGRVNAIIVAIKETIAASHGGGMFGDEDAGPDPDGEQRIVLTLHGKPFGNMEVTPRQIVRPLERPPTASENKPLRVEQKDALERAYSAAVRKGVF